MSSNVAERVGRELYAPPYVAAVDAGVGTVMCAFVRVNNTYACENESLLKEWLFGDMGFDGTVVSDWTATHSTVASILAGLSVEQEWLLNATFYGSNLTQAVLAGKVPVSAVDDAALRVLTTIYATTDLGDTPSPPSRNVSSSVNTTAHASLARRLAVAGTVLLKNTGGLLPLDPSTLCRVVVVGDPEDTVAGGGSGGVEPPYVVSPMQGLQAALPRTTLIYLDGKNATAAGEAASNADVAIVIVGERTSEGMDRVGLALPPGQDDMVRAVAAGQPKTVVVARCSGACLMPWVGDVPAIVNALYGGQEAGNALADILLGAATPAGKLTVSFPMSNNDTWLSPPGGGPIIPSSYPGTDRGRGYPEVDYSEGLEVGYRFYDAQGTDPLFSFGHGLSYTSFNYGNLSVVGTTVSFSVTNNGTDYPGGEVAQVYVAGAFPGDPPKQLKGFKYTGVLPVGYQVEVNIVLEPLVYWSVEEHAFVSFPPGDYTVWVGSSSRDLRLQGAVRVQAT
jgi:beta-glucosidase